MADRLVQQTASLIFKEVLPKLNRTDFRNKVRSPRLSRLPPRLTHTQHTHAYPHRPKHTPALLPIGTVGTPSGPWAPQAPQLIHPCAHRSRDLVFVYGRPRCAPHSAARHGTTRLGPGRFSAAAVRCRWGCLHKAPRSLIAKTSSRPNANACVPVSTRLTRLRPHAVSATHSSATASENACMRVCMRMCGHGVRGWR